MKLYLIFALVWITTFDLMAADLPSPTLSLTIESMSQDGHITIGIHNKSANEIRVWTSCYSWAYFNWRVIDIRNDEMRLYCPYPDEGFTMNFPAYATIKPGAMITEELKLGGKDKWVNNTRPLIHWVGPKDTQPLLQNGDKIIVTYDVRWSNEANQYHVWTGLTAVSKDYHPN
jgi:hypothetical protein